jgi:histidyl-tRNA synthetase
MADAPSILDSLCDECRAHFKILTDSLKDLDVSFVVNKQIVRGLDYYTRTIFEIQTGSLGAQSAVVGGGRYDNLMKMLGGPDLPATGFAVGFDRLVEIVGPNIGSGQKAPDIFMAALGEESTAKAFNWSCALGNEGIYAEVDVSGRSLKSLMKRADKLGVDRVLILGEKELSEGAAILRDMKTKAQETIPIDAIIEALKRRLKK